MFFSVKKETVAHAQWRAANREKVNGYGAAYCRRNPEKTLYRTAKNRAKRLSWDFTITLRDVVIPIRCPVLGIVLTRGAGHGRDSSPSLDRWDTSKGYVPGNVWVISWRANRLKNDATIEELEAIVRALRSRTSP